MGNEPEQGTDEKGEEGQSSKPDAVFYPAPSLEDLEANRRAVEEAAAKEFAKGGIVRRGGLEGPADRALRDIVRAGRRAHEALLRGVNHMGQLIERAAVDGELARLRSTFPSRPGAREWEMSAMIDGELLLASDPHSRQSLALRINRLGIEMTNSDQMPQLRSGHVYELKVVLREHPKDER